MGLPISRITIKKFMSIETLDFTPTAITLFKGKNARGKTSAMTAILAAFQGGEASMVREGEAEAEVGILLRDGSTIDRRVKAEGKQPRPRIKPQGGAAVDSPAAWLKERVDDLINPMDFITARPEKRQEWLLQAVPLRLSFNELIDSLGECSAFVPVEDVESAATEHALLAIERLETRLYNARTEANTTAIAKRKTQEQLRGSLPPADSEATDWAVVEATLAGELGGLDTALRARQREIERDEQAEKKSAVKDFENARAAIVSDINARIAALKQEGERRIAEASAVERKRSEAASSKAVSEQETATGEASASRAGLAGSLGEARARRSEAERVSNTREIIAGLEDEAGLLEAERAAYTGALERFDVLKAGLLERMPLAGIEPRGGRLYRNGLPFERLNTAQIMDVAMEVAELRAGRIGLVCVDGIERLDTEQREAWYERAKASGLNYFFSQVTDDPGLVMENESGEVIAAV